MGRQSGTQRVYIREVKRLCEQVVVLSSFSKVMKRGMF